MQIEVSPEFREQSYSGESLYDAKLTINGNEVPTSQISKIKINSPIVDTTKDIFYVGTFISQEITITFKNLDNLDIKTGNEVYLEIGQQINGEYEYIPIGHYLIDDLSENYSSTCEIPCLDYATKFKPNVDYSPCFVDDKASIDTILEWLCEYFNVEIGDYPSINGNVEVSTYDSTVSGKQWISYIAELKGCNAKIGRDGKLYLIPLKQQPTTTIDALKSKSWSLGEKYEISKVVYSDAIRNFTFGDDTENTLYIRPDNPFVTGTYAEQIVENIYNEVDGFEVYSLKVQNYGDLSLDCWNIVTYTLGEDGEQNPITYNTFYANNMVYEMNVMVTNETKISTKQQETTTNVIGSGDDKAKIRKLSTTVDGLEGTITLLAEEVGEYDGRITTVEQDVNSIRQTAISYEDLKRTAKSIRMLHLENVVESYPLKFTIKNAKTLFPQESLYPSSNTIPENNYLVLIVDKTQTLSDEAKFIELPIKNLYSMGEVYDEFVVEKTKAYLIHRLMLNQDNTLSVLSQEFIEELPDVNIPLFEGDNYIYLCSLINDGAIYEINYTIPSELTDIFATEVYVNSSIEQTANQILLQVNEKVDEEEIIAKLNVAVEDGQGIVELKGNSVIIESDNFTLDADGKIDATAGEIGGFDLDATSFSVDVSETKGPFTSSDVTRIMNIFSGNITPTAEDYEKYDINGDGAITSVDYANVRLAVNNYGGYITKSGTFSINSNAANEVLLLKDTNDNIIARIGMMGQRFSTLGADQITLATEDNSDLLGNINSNGVSATHVSTGAHASMSVALDGSDAYLELADSHNNYMNYSSGNIYISGTLTQGSQEERKKNFEKLTNAKEILQNTDIYKYNFKNEEDTEKKHIGFVIGDKFNYSKEITSAENNGVDIYAMVSVLWQVVKEQQDEIDELKKLIKESDK